MSCQYKRNDGTPCRCGELAIEDGAVVGHYDCVGPHGTMCPPDGSLPLRCRICEAPCGDGLHDPGRCANCYNMGIVGFNAGKILTETHIQEYLASIIDAIPEARALELTKWFWAITSASARSELAARRGV